MDDNDEKNLTELEKKLLKIYRNMDADAKVAMLKTTQFVAERSDNLDPISEEEFAETFKRFRQENIRVRLGGKVGETLNFPGTSNNY